MLTSLLRELRKPISIELRQSNTELFGQAFDKGCRLQKMKDCPFNREVYPDEYYHFRNGVLFARKRIWESK